MTELQRLQRLEAEVLATAEQQPLAVLEWCQLGVDDEPGIVELMIDLAYLQAHPDFAEVGHAVLLGVGEGLRTTLAGRSLGVLVRAAADFLRARDSGAACQRR